ncbi:hypothetical protein ACFYPT_41345 [Streptomyces sp. NPDC005529]|uniref:hypothetical protein n=1 Tax=unclassified Streptomyces TaxID=2593676 RepID=UPI0033BC2073
MDLYLLSDICEYTMRDDYKSYMASRTAALQYFPHIHERVPRNFLNAMTAKLGVPVFPAGVQSEVRRAGMPLDDVVAAIDSGEVVMVGTANHWRVIYGYVRVSGAVCRILAFDTRTGTYQVDVARDFAGEEIIIAYSA